MDYMLICRVADCLGWAEERYDDALKYRCKGVTLAYGRWLGYDAIPRIE